MCLKIKKKKPIIITSKVTKKRLNKNKILKTKILNEIDGRNENESKLIATYHIYQNHYY